MLSKLARSGSFAVLAFTMSAITPSPAAARVTPAQAIASVKFLAGPWHCTGDGPPEDDVYTISKNVWRDVDTVGGVTSGTFDAKRQKWVVMFMNASGEYGVNEASPAVNGTLHLTVPYPPGMSSMTYSFTKLTDTKFKLGKQFCVKKAS